MDSNLLLRAALIQAISVAVLFGILVALPLDKDFFKDYGAIVGPLAWLLCALVSWRLLKLPGALVGLAAVAGGIAGALVGLASSHLVGLVVAIGVFGAACGGYEDEEPTPAT